MKKLLSSSFKTHNNNIVIDSKNIKTTEKIDIPKDITKNEIKEEKKDNNIEILKKGLVH